MCNGINVMVYFTLVRNKASYISRNISEVTRKCDVTQSDKEREKAAILKIVSCLYFCTFEMRSFEFGRFTDIEITLQLNRN